jgi:PKD repeat protein
VQNEVSPVHTYKETGIYTVELFVKNDFGCIDIIYKPLSITLPEKGIGNLIKPNVAHLENRSNNLVKEIFTEHDSVKITLFDNGEIDGDSITLIYNNIVLASKKMLTATPLTFTLKIDPERANNELIMYAENLGSIPPNTALMVINDGDKRYEINVSSTKTTNGVVSFKVKR